MVVSFAFFLLLFVAIGISSVRFSRGSGSDYYLASRSVQSWLVGLSAVATNNSGYMFIGVIGYTYATGLASIWLMIGWIVGDLMASLYVHQRLQKASADHSEDSFPGAIANWDGVHRPAAQKLAALIALLFLTAYATAQLVAGSKALFVILDWPIWSGALLGAVMVAAYCMAGGIRASIWTDAAQSFVMIIAMFLLLFIAVQNLGGVGSAWNQMGQIPGFLDLFPSDLPLPGLAGGLLFALGWLFAGFSVLGQPHIMVRFMALDQGHSMVVARVWYYLWFTLFYCAATGVGMLSRIYLSDPGDFDAELALPTMALELLPDVGVGLILAGLFAATISTADSLILSASAALTKDLKPAMSNRPLMIKLATLGVTLFALLLALSNTQSVFDLVIFAWSTMASAFAPVMLVHCRGGNPSTRTLIAMMLVGAGTAISWRLLGWNSFVYEGLPGILAGFLPWWISRLTR